MYTGKVRFLPLRSQGIEKRQNELSALDSLGIPASSPKSLYRFADIVSVSTCYYPSSITDRLFSTR